MGRELTRADGRGHAEGTPSEAVAEIDAGVGNLLLPAIAARTGMVLRRGRRLAATLAAR